MSVTTTSNVQTYNIRATLADYDLHHTPETDPFDPSLNEHPSPNSTRHDNPAYWPTDERRIPAYRPINTELDQSQRRVYQNGVERTFVAVMFTGVFLEATASKVWRATFVFRSVEAFAFMGLFYVLPREENTDEEILLGVI